MQGAEGANAKLVREMFALQDRLAETPIQDLLASAEEWEPWLDFFSETIVWEAAEDAPDAGTYRGHDGIRGYAEDWLSTLDSMYWELRDLTELGECLVADIHAGGRMKGSEGEVAIDYSQAMLIEDGKITRVKEFFVRGDAVACAEAWASPD